MKTDCTTKTDTQFLDFISSLFPWFDLQCSFRLLVSIRVSSCRVCVCGGGGLRVLRDCCFGSGLGFFLLFFLNARFLRSSTLNLSFTPWLKGRPVSVRYQLEGLMLCSGGAGLNFHQGDPRCQNGVSRQDQPWTGFMRCWEYNTCLCYHGNGELWCW